jgi:hypothetical protein
MKKTVHNAKSLTKALVSFILENATGHRTSFDVSDVKGDGTVFVRFRSSPHDPAVVLAEGFSRALNARNMAFVQTDDNKFRLPLEQFGA